MSKGENQVAAFIAFIWLIPGMFLRGWLLSILWNWFAVPLGVLYIGPWHAFGIGLIYSVLSYKYKKFEPYSTDQALARIASSIFFVIFVLVIAAIVKALAGL